MVLMVHIQSYSRGAKYDMMLPPASIPPEGTPAARDSHSKQASLRLRFGHDTANDPSLIQPCCHKQSVQFHPGPDKSRGPRPGDRIEIRFHNLATQQAKCSFQCSFEVVRVANMHTPAARAKAPEPSHVMYGGLVQALRTEHRLQPRSNVINLMR